MRKQITLKDLYLKYPYKYVESNSNTVPLPYVSKDEISDHEYKLTYKQWRKVITTYFKYVAKYMISGNPLKLPHGLGSLVLNKYKPKNKKIDFKRTAELYGEINKTLPAGQKKLAYHNNRHTNGYCPILVWRRYMEKFRYKWHWRFELLPGVWSEISDTIMKDPSIINRWNKAKKQSV